LDDDAIRTVDAILKDYPKDADARSVRATLRMENGNANDLNAAIDEFTSAPYFELVAAYVRACSALSFSCWGPFLGGIGLMLKWE
jgi:hypothetical protein